MDPLPPVRFELRHGTARPTQHYMTEASFLVGSVPGCDLRLPGTALPPVFCLISRDGDRLILRKLAPTQPVLVNGQPVTVTVLASGDRLTLAGNDLQVDIAAWFQAGAAQPEGAGEKTEAQPAESTSPPAGANATHEQQRQELALARQQLYDQYRQRRDRLKALQDAIRKAARKVQEHKRTTDMAAHQLLARRRELDAREADLEARAAEVDQAQHEADALRKGLTRQQQEQQHRIADRLADLDTRGSQSAAAPQAPEKEAQHQAELLRFDRLVAQYEERQEQLQEQIQDLDRRSLVHDHDAREPEAQAPQLEEAQPQTAAGSERVAQQSALLDQRAAELAERSAAVEKQQALIETLRSRLEGMREETRRESEVLASERTRHQAVEQELERRAREAQERREQLDNERHALEAERAEFRQRQAEMQDLPAREADVGRRLADCNAREAEQAEQAALVQARLDELGEQRQRLDADRQALCEREANLARAEQAREALQEQLRRRSEELNDRQKALEEQVRQHEQASRELQQQRSDLELHRAAGDQQRRQETDALSLRLEALNARHSELEAWSQKLDERQRQLQEMGLAVASERQALGEDHARLTRDRQATGEQARQLQAEVAARCAELDALEKRLPEQEQQARTAVERHEEARQRLREHLAELHRYADQGHETLEALRSQLLSYAEDLRQQLLALHRAREEHRLAVAKFRQQIIDWQGQIGEMKRALAQGETRLERRQAEVDQQARAVDADAARLAKKAEELDHRQRAVLQRQSEVECHLEEMRQWYRRQLREFSHLPTEEAEAAPRRDDAAHARNILSLTGDIAPGDRQLGDLLRSLELVDADTLSVLLVAARRQRRSLRQMLLTGGYLTLYQLALIEAGNVDALVLGPTRVVDRLRATSREAVYRVFDPRRGKEVVLRLLAEAEAQDAIRPDEFRQRFSAAATVLHPNLAATLEMLEIAGRPAVLQEWLTGLHSSDWPSLASVPGVWYRLLSQAALGLHTIHQAGLVHGHLDADSILLTPEGLVKVCGFGEPAWLVEPPEAGDNDEPREESPAGDLAALGRIAAAWVAPRSGKKAKPLPEALQAVLHGLDTDNEGEHFASAKVLLEALDHAGSSVPPNAEAWDRLLRHVRESLSNSETVLRRSA